MEIHHIGDSGHSTIIKNGCLNAMVTEPYPALSWELVLHKYLQHLPLHLMLVKLKYFSFK